MEFPSFEHLIRNIKFKEMKKMILGCMLAIASTSIGQASLGEVSGTVRDGKTNAIIFGAHVYIEDGDKKYQAKTDAEGYFRISAIPAGSYLLNIKHDGDTMRNIPAKVDMDAICRLGEIKFLSKIQDVGVVVITGTSKNQIKLIDGNLPVTQISYEDIQKSPSKFDPKGMVAYLSSDVKLTDDGELVFRGARKGDMLYLLDGVKTSDIGSIPSCAIGRMMIYSGGLPAKYGDTMGGVVVMETLSYFDLYRDWYGEQVKAGKM